jgi:hypothetical protein
MFRPQWVPVPYYYSGPLAKLPPVSAALPHKLGYIPKYLRAEKLNNAPKKD